jgi:hypothetical protein
LQKAHAAITSDKLVKKDWEVFSALADFTSVVLKNPFEGFLKLQNLKYTLNWNELISVPYWIATNSIYTLHFCKTNFSRNSIFSLRIFNYYWNDYFSINSKTMANCAKLVLYKNFIYR